MRILIPDARFVGVPDLEQAILPSAQLEVYRVRTAEQIPEASWRACDAVVIWHQLPLGEPTVSLMEKCRLVVRAGIGFDQIDVAACAAHGIPVANCPDYGVTDVADHAIALFLALARGVTHFQDALRADIAGAWNPRGAPLIGRVRGRRFGIVGLGRIGTAVLKRAQAFDMEPGFHDPYIPFGMEQSVAARRLASLEELLEWADVVSLHVPRTRDTIGMIGRDQLARMKEGAILINTARGPVIDLDALARSMREGRPAGAGLDVLPQEPPDPEHPLIAAWRNREPWIDGRLLLTPHAAFYSTASFEDMRRKPFETLRLYLEEGRLRNCVNAHQLARNGHDLSHALMGGRWEETL